MCSGIRDQVRVETGAVDAYAGDKIKLIGLLAQSKDPARLAMLVEVLSFEPYAMALPRKRFRVSPRGEQRTAGGLVPAEFDSRMNIRTLHRRMKMTNMFGWRRAVAALPHLPQYLAGCNTPPAPGPRAACDSNRNGRIDHPEQRANVNSTVGMIGGALVGGGLGSLVGGGNGQTVATIVGAGAGAWGGNQLAQRSQTLVWRIGVRYDDGTFATVQQTSAPALHR
jgi:hypothetical protein